MRGRTSRIYLLLGLLFGLLAMISGIALVRGSRGQAGDLGRMVRIPVASRELKPGETLDASSLSWHDFPERLLPKGIISDPRDALGKRLVVSVGEGEPLFLSQLYVNDTALDPSSLPAGMCAFPLSSQVVSYPLHELRSGQRLDVISVGETEATVLLKDVEVMALSLPPGERDDGTYPSGGHVFLKLTEDEACLLARSLKTGQVELVLSGGSG
ncbi:MAG: SAF domain-containing protein [Candidatus Geothermincolales bacterium]